jgi:hypothetical protein
MQVLAGITIAAVLLHHPVSATGDSLRFREPTAGPVLRPAFTRVTATLSVDSAQGQRPHAVEYSRAYETRLAIHHWSSFATLPLFAAEYYVGQKLIHDAAPDSRWRGPHQAVATGVAGLFALNTVTGVWNLWDARKDPNDRVRRYVHAALMIAADAGFVATAATAPDDDGLAGSRSAAAGRHRGIAVASMGAAAVGYVMMLVWK